MELMGTCKKFDLCLPRIVTYLEATKKRREREREKEREKEGE